MGFAIAEPIPKQILNGPVYDLHIARYSKTPSVCGVDVTGHLIYRRPI
jgi:hypothetical protein